MKTRFQRWAAWTALLFGFGLTASGFARCPIPSGGSVFTDKVREWGFWEGWGMDVVIRLIDPEEELAEFLYQCDEFFEEEEVNG